MSAIERAEQDVARGDLWLARMRLACYLNSKGYDPDVVNRLGRICFDMHDTYAAGRYWLVGTAQGDDVAAAIEVFLRHTAHAPDQIGLRLPRAARRMSFVELPIVVQEKLTRRGLAASWKRWQPPPKTVVPSDRLGKLLGLVLLVAALGTVASCAVGARQILGWLLGGD